MICVVLTRIEVNLLDLLTDQMLDCKQNVHKALALQPYIMALVVCTVTSFYGRWEVQHCIFLPYLRDEAFLKRPSSP